MVRATAQASNPLIIVWASATGGALHLQWNISTAWSLSELESFHVLVNNQERVTVGPDASGYYVCGLSNNTVYSYQVKATLVNGSGPLYSDVIAATTLDRTAPNSPDIPKQLAVTGGFVQVSVELPQDTGGAALSNVTVVVSDSVSVVTKQSLPVTSSDVLVYNIYGLNARTKYWISAFATNEGDLVSPNSDPLVITTTTLQLPGPCPPPTVVKTTGASILLQLNLPLDDGGGRIQGYNVYMTTNNAGDFTEVATTIDTDTIDAVEVLHSSDLDDAPLLPNTRYFFKAVAVNLADICMSVPISLQLTNVTEAWTTAASVPGAPPSPYFLKATGGMITMLLMKPANMQGAKCIGFSIKIGDDAGNYLENRIDADDDVTFNATSLHANSSYAISVAIITDLGTSSYSTPTIMNTTAPTAPSKPRDITVGNVTGSSALLEWSLPVDSGDADIIGFTIILMSPGGQEEISALSSPILLESLVANTVYSVKMTATNAAGKKSTRTVGGSFNTMPLTPPGKPLDISLIFATGGAIEIAWNPSQNRGGELLSSMEYKATAFRAAPCFKRDISSPCSACNSVKLKDSQYQFIDDASVCEQPTTQCPDSTFNCCLTRKGSSHGFGLSCGLMTPVTESRAVVGTTSTFFNGLNYSSTYYFSVQASNRAGKSAVSELQGFQTTVQTSPSYPSSLRQLGATGGSIQLTWDAPLDTGGGPIVGYHVYRNYELLTPRHIMPPYTDCGGMAAETTYVYGVAAVNASLIEGAIAAIKLPTEALSTPLAPSLSLVGSMSNRLQVSVIPPCDTGGETTLSYQYMVKNAGTVVGSASFNCCTFVVENLEPDQSYSVLVKVENSLSASSPWAQAMYKTASGIPPTPTAMLLQVNTYSAVVALGSKAYDKETRSFDILLHRSGIGIQSYTVSCEEDTNFDHYVCPASYKLETLEAAIEYEVSVQANGLLGSSESNFVSFETTGISYGTFGMANTNYNADKDGIITTRVLRSNGTSGAVEVGVHVTEPDTVFLRCKRATSGACDCTLYLISSEAVPQPCYLSFADGQENASVTFSLWDDQSAELLPSQVVVSPFGVDLSGQHSAILHMDARQQAGFMSFPLSPSNVYEDASFVMINVVRLNGTAGRIGFSFESFDITAVAGEDYVAVSGTGVLADQQSSTQLWIQLIDNHVVNTDKTFGLRLTGQPELSAGDHLVTHKVTIHDDESISSAVPRKLDNISIEYTTGGEFEIGWASTASDGVGTTGYLVRVSNARLGTFYSVYNTTRTFFTLSGLSARSIYIVEVALWNDFGVGEYSDALEVATTDASLASAPLSLGATDISNTAFTLTWKPPQDDGGSPVMGYYLSVEDMDGNRLRSELINTTKLLVVVDGLNASSDYDCYVSCSTEAFPDNKDETSTAQIRIKTAIGVAPGAPPAVTLVGQPRGGTLVFSMRRPGDRGGMPLAHCVLYLRKAAVTGSTTEEAFTVACSIGLSDDTDPMCASSNLLASTSYEVYAVFSNAMGGSLPGERAVVKTNAAIDLPSPPLNLRAPTVTAGNIKLEWDEPADLGGAAGVVGYIVYQKYDVLKDAYFTLYDGQDSTERSFITRGLTRNSAYAFAVVALNDASFCIDPDQHNISSFLEVSTLVSSPLSPPGLPYRVSASGGAITIGWGLPDDLAGLELQGYYVELVTTSSSSGFEVLNSFPPSVTNFTHYGLSENTSYRYAVTATNQDGSSERSGILTTSTSVASRPTWVRSFRPVESTGGSITLTWDPPQDTGGRHIEHYKITRAGRSSSYSVTSTTFEDRSGLSASSDYTYTITAFNGLYSGYAISVVAATGLPVISDPPVFESVIPFGGRLEVSWEAPEFTGGTPIIEYVITLFSGDQSATIETITTESSSCTFRSLKANTPYLLSGQALNDQGGSLVVKFTVETASPDAPDAPPIPEARNIRGGSVDIHVAKPSYTGGEEVTLTLYQDGARVHTFVVNEWDATIYGLIAETDYAFSVSAKNSAGENKSQALPVTTTVISTPGQVQNLQKVFVTFSQMALMWDAVQDMGGDEHVQYEVTFFKCSSAGVQEEDPQMKRTDSTKVVIEDLQYSSFYSVNVVAITSTSLVGDVSSSLLVETEQPFEGVIVAASSEMTVKENAGVVSVPITRVNGSFGNVSYSFDVVDGSASSGVNYVRATGTRTLTTNVVSDSVDITVISDSVYNPGISFQVIITDSNTALPSTTDVRLEDDGDAGFISFADPALMVLENSGMAYLTITRTGGRRPRSVLQTFVSSNNSVINRFQLLDSTVVFEEDVAQQTISVSITDDSEFQYVADSVTIGFKILEGGVLNGTYTTATLTALDDGDISFPKQCLNLQKTSVTGGSLGLQWTPPVDRGGADILLSYLVSIAVGTEIIIKKESPTEAITLYGLNQSTTYQVSVQAVNYAGAGVSSTSLLIATRPATAPTAPRNIQVLSASSSSVLIQWDSPLDDGGSAIVAYKIYKVSGATTSTRSLYPSVSCSTPTVCTIKQLLALTSYNIQVQASTAFVTQGEYSEVVTLTTSSPVYPDMPPIAAVTWASAGAMTIGMFDPVNIGGANIQEYRLFMRADDEVEFASVFSGASAEHTVYRLRYQTVYYIKYQVVNSVGPSAYSPIVSNQTLSKSLPSAPTDVSVIDKTGGAITLAWNEPLDVGGREVTGYTVKIVSIGGNSANVVGYDGKGIPARQGTVYGLAAHTDYSMQVVAYLDVSSCFDSALQAWSSVIQVSTTTATPPRTAPELLAGHYTGGIIELVWVAPKDKGGVPLTGYTLYLLTSAESPSVLFSTNNASILSFVHKDLTASTKYTYTIKTPNAAGESPLSSPLVATTDTISFPSAPLNVRQLSYTTGGAITIGWDRSFDTGGQPIAGYMVYRNGELVSGTLSADTRSFTNKDRLTASTSYSYNVRTIALNLMVSMASEECSAKTTAATKPQKIQSLTAVPGSSFLNVSWIPDGDSGGLPIISYDVKLMLYSTLVESVTMKTASFYLFTGLTASTSYTGYVKVNNDIGASQEVSATLATTSVSVPNSPRKPLVTSVYGGNFTIQVEPPLFTGGSPVTDMKVYEFILDVATLKTTLKVVPGTPTSYTFYSVSASTKYPVACSAINSVGEGPLCEVVTIQTTSQNQPGPILTAPVSIGATGTTLSISWSPPADTGGSLDLSYDVRVVNLTTDAINPTVNLTYTATQLAYSSAYSFSVRAVNNNGNGIWSPVRIATTQPDAAGEFNFAQSSVSVLENATQLDLVVQRSSGLSGRITLSYSTESTGTQPATLGSDYFVTKDSSITTGTIVFEPLQSQNSIVILIINDSDYENPDKTFAVRITDVKSSLPEGRPKIGSNNVTTVTIVDDGDAGFVSFEKPAYAFLEDSRTATVTIIREYGKSINITLSFDFWGGTASPDIDYSKTTTPVVMDNGVTKASFTFSIINDKIFEYPDEYFFIRMTVSGGAKLRQPLTRITILDDGDISDPGTCPPPQLLSVTGGLATFATDFPDHNGSATGAISNYVVRLSTETNSTDFTKAVAPTFTIGNLTALTSYNVTIAATNSFGLGTFSNATQFSTTAPSLPGGSTLVAIESRTGGRISLTWSTPEDTGGTRITKYRVYIVGRSDVPQLVAEYLQPTPRGIIYGLNASTAYNFSVQAGNAVNDTDGWGNFSASFRFSTTLATQPGSVILHPDAYKKPTGGKIFLSWNAPLDTGGTSISSYSIFAKSASRPWFLSATASPSLNPVFAGVAALNASTTYEFFVLAGSSVPSMSLPGKFSIAEGSRIMRTSVDLSNRMSVGSVLSVQDSVFVVDDMSNAVSGTIILKYDHLTTSIVSQSGRIMGQATTFSVLNTSEPTLPDLPPVPVLSITTGGMINVTLLSPEDTGGIPILDFSLYWDGQKLKEDSYVKTTSKANYLQLRAFVSVPKLRAQTTYNVSAVALNSLSLCNFGRVTTGPSGYFTTTKVTAPGTPQLVTYRTTGGGITMSMIDPHDTGGNDIQQYQLYYKRSGTSDPWQLVYNGPKHQATIARLNNSTEYAFLASVYNGEYSSVNSSVKVVRTIKNSPPGSCEPARRVNATGGMLEVAWDSPADNGGSEVTGFYATIASHLDGSGRMTFKTNTTSFAFYRLLAEYSYDVVVRANNSYGLGPESPIATFNTTKATPPVGKIDVTVQMTTGGAAEISFGEPIDLGGAVPSDMMYSIYLDQDNTLNVSYDSLEDATSSVSVGTRRLTEVVHRRLETSTLFSNIVVGDMDPDTLYGIRILPISKYASGGISSTFAVETTGASIPSAPVGLSRGGGTGGSVSLSWGPPVDSGGIPLNEYSLSMSNVSKDGPFNKVYEDFQATTTIYKLHPGTTYWAYVTAWNDVGESPQSEVLTFTTRSVTAPSAPQNFRIVAVGSTSVDCAWEMPSDIGGDSIDMYTITVTTGDPPISVLFTTNKTLTSLTGLNASTSYSISMTARNTFGDSSPPSLVRYARTSSGTNVPSTPQIGCVSRNSVELSWYPYPGATATYHVERAGVDIGTTTSLTFVDKTTLSTATSYRVWTTQAALSEPVTVTTLDPSEHILDAICQGRSGHIRELNYSSNVSKEWKISPMSSYSYITLTFSTFELECDHDYVEILDAQTKERLWKGGCIRTGRFIYQAKSSVIVAFTTDASVTAKGFEMQYEIDGTAESSRIPLPGNGIACSGHGRRQSDGSCKCSVGFTGEGCNNRIVCCSDPKHCHHSVCDMDPAKVIVVSGEFGDDRQGTGRMMDTNEGGTASKAVKTISRALELSKAGSAILVYPGVYSGPLNRDLKVDAADLTITTLKGPFWTNIDCSKSSRFLLSESSKLLVDGLALENCVDADGGVFRIVDGEFTGTNLHITDTNATHNGGVLYASGSSVTLHQVAMANTLAEAEGGALYLEDSTATMIESNVTKSTALRGGAVALRGTSSLFTTNTRLSENIGLESGGGVFVDGMISLKGVYLSNNEASSGGGLAMNNGELALESCVISDNKAETGGGLALSGNSDLVTIATVIQSNKAATGGGVYISGTVNVTFDTQVASPSTITGNTALDGAGMYIYDSQASFRDIIVEIGYANESAGGVAIVDSNVRWFNVIIQDNEALQGGGLALKNSQVTCKGPVLITRNSAVDGGGIWMSTSAMTGLDGTHCLRNKATKNGGAIFVVGDSTVKDFEQELNVAPYGGCVYAEKANLNLENSQVRNCSADVAGGGIWLKDSHVSMKNVAVELSTAPDGGGLFAIASSVSGEMTIETCNGVKHGGGMYLLGETAITGVIVDGCDSKEGGAAYVVDADLVVESCKLSNSYASVNGGGLYAVTSTIELKDTSILTDTSASLGGGIYMEKSTIVHDGVSIDRCSSNLGGGVYLNESKMMAKSIPSSSQVSAGHASDVGGNLFLSGLSSVEQLVVSSGKAESGGGVAINSVSATIQGCSIVNNSAGFGGGIIVQAGSICNLVDSVVSTNVADKTGGGIGIVDALVWHENLSVLSNAAPRGGGVFATGMSAMLILSDSSQQSTIRGNNADPSAGFGGGIYAAPSSQVKASGLALLDGKAYRGAGIYVDGAVFVLNDTLFQSGNASDGGGIYANYASNLELTNCSFIKNNASQSGGGVAMGSGVANGDSNTLSMTNCSLTGNSAGTGGGIVLSLTNMKGLNCLLTKNTAKSGGAVAVASECSVTLTNWEFINNTVVKNELGIQGGTLYITKGVVTISNSSLVSNEKATLALNGGLIYVENSDTTLTIINSLLAFGQAYSGGLIYSSSANVIMRNSTLYRGFGYDFGAGIYAVNALLDISDSKFLDNFAFYDGGGIYMTEGGELAVTESFFDLNEVQDRGGAIFLDPGAAITATVSNSNFIRNKNVGFGSTIFVGRKNTAQLKGCILSGNGNDDTEGGTLSVVDAIVDIEDSLFEFNIASKGAAIQISRSTNLTILQTTIRNNSATFQGGALHASIRAVATFTDCNIEGNIAGEGGGVYAMGSAAITLLNSKFTANTARAFGGAISMRGSAVLTSIESLLIKNQAYTGGAVSIQENASFSVTNNGFQDNNASDFGAGIYIDKSTEAETQIVGCKSSQFGGNTAAAGADIFWVYYPWLTFECVACTKLTGHEAVLMSTSAMTITPGWWPPSVTSGVSLGVDMKTISNSTSGLTSPPTTSSQSAAVNASLTKPGSTVLWPTIVVRDYYGAIASFDNVTRCRASLAVGEVGPFSFSPTTWVTDDAGYILFEDAEVLSKSRDYPYQLTVNCTLSPVLQTQIIVDVTVDKCNPGYENVNGLCLSCEKGTYSLDGERCYLCPPGATCEQKDQRGTTTGVISPQRQQGYFVSKTRSTYAASSCNDPESWVDDDPCKAIDVANLTARIHECASEEPDVFSKYWSRARVYSCLSGNEYYACDTNAACIAASTVSTSSTVSISTAAVQSESQCARGYSGIMCATCADGYYKASSGTCKQCTDPKDPAVARTTRMLAMLPIIVAVFALLFLYYLFSNAAEQRVVSSAQAAKRFQIYTGQSRARALLLATKANIQRRVRSMMRAAAKRARFGRQDHPYLFQIEPRDVEIPSWRPEKFKIMLGFFQVIGSFKEVYEIPWPDTMSRLMDICSLADFNFVDATAAECLFRRDYFTNYRLALFALLGLLLLVFLVTFWGILRYRVKLSTLPRHCVSCGLPVFTLEHRSPPVLERRAALLAKLKLEQKMNAKSVQVDTSSVLGRLKSTLRRSPKPTFENAESWRIVRLVMRALNWVDRATQLPASLSTHKPRCPISQRIKNDVLDMVVHSNLRLWRARVWMRLYYKAYQNRCIKLLFWVLLLFYPMLCQRVIGTFYCDEVGDHYYLSLDRSNLCYEGTWLYYLPISITLIIFWVIGVPLLFWVIIFMKRTRGVRDTLLLIQDPSQESLKQRLLLKMRLDIIDHGQVVDEEKIQLFETEMLAHFLCDKNLNEPSTVAQVGFIYHSYSTHFWWFEVWDLGRKLLLNCIISLLAKAGANRVICGLVVLLVYLSVMLFYQPYREPSDSALAGLVHIQLFITLFCGLILKMGLLYLEERVVRLVTNAAIITNMMTLCYAVVSILNEKRNALKMVQRQTREDHRRAIAAHARKLWRKAFGYALTEVYLDNPNAGPMPLLVMTELARRRRYERDLDELNAQLELTSAVNPPPAARDQQDAMVSASQINVLEDEDDEPDENLNDPFETNSDLADNEQNVMASTS
ncbi:hypothetical protein PC123_g5228 [Phytophthora cactorum]|nr:hypothetical protein PC123_g5228 [Phytophthora cactorum]